MGRDGWKRVTETARLHVTEYAEGWGRPMPREDAELTAEDLLSDEQHNSGDHNDLVEMLLDMAAGQAVA
jgi:hypothetical protein